MFLTPMLSLYIVFWVKFAKEFQLQRERVPYVNLRWQGMIELCDCSYISVALGTLAPMLSALLFEV